MVDGRGKNIASLRNLPQFKGLTDEEIEEKVHGKSFEERVEARIAFLAEHYDLSDMKYNDLRAIREWAVLTERLDEEEKALRELKEQGEITTSDALREEQRLSIVRRDISSLEAELNITRAKRHNKTEDDPRLLYEDIRSRAHRFLQERLTYLVCSKCEMLLTTVWFHYPESDNSIILTCGKCGHVTEYTSEEAVEIERTNPYK